MITIISAIIAIGVGIIHAIYQVIRKLNEVEEAIKQISRHQTHLVKDDTNANPNIVINELKDNYDTNE